MVGDKEWLDEYVRYEICCTGFDLFVGLTGKGGLGWLVRTLTALSTQFRSHCAFKVELYCKY